jgi:hypothetical protein
VLPATVSFVTMADLATGTQNASDVSGIGQDIKSESKSERAREPADDGSLTAKLANDLDEGDDCWNP